MTHINCEDCLKIYRPYGRGIALLRVLMYGFSDCCEFEDERIIREQFREHLCDRNHPNKRWRLIKETRRYMRDVSFASNFNIYYQYLENKRRKHILATFLCLECEKYYCRNCVRKHSGHFTFSKNDQYDKSKWRRISVEILEKLNVEGDQKLENMKREKTYLCDVVDVRCEYDELNLRDVLHTLEENEGNDYGWMLLRKFDFPNIPSVVDLHVLNDIKSWLVTDYFKKCIEIFNVNDNKMIRRIKLSSSPHGITEIPSTDPSQSLIAVSFPQEKQIHIMNIHVHSTPAQVMSTINVQDRCRDLAYCNNKLITNCVGLPGRDSIHVIDTSGEIINIIYLHSLQFFILFGNPTHFASRCMYVHAESETIYVCQGRGPPYVVSLSLDGQVLHSVTFTDLEPELIHVDKDLNVYVMSHQLPIYKLSADLKNRETIIGKDAIDTSFIMAMKFHHGKYYLAAWKGLVYIIQHE